MFQLNFGFCCLCSTTEISSLANSCQLCTPGHLHQLLYICSYHVLPVILYLVLEFSLALESHIRPRQKCTLAVHVFAYSVPYLCLFFIAVRFDQLFLRPYNSYNVPPSLTRLNLLHMIWDSTCPVPFVPRPRVSLEIMTMCLALVPNWFTRLSLFGFSHALPGHFHPRLASFCLSLMGMHQLHGTLLEVALTRVWAESM